MATISLTTIFYNRKTFHQSIKPQNNAGHSDTKIKNSRDTILSLLFCERVYQCITLAKQHQVVLHQAHHVLFYQPVQQRVHQLIHQW